VDSGRRSESRYRAEVESLATTYERILAGTIELSDLGELVHQHGAASCVFVGSGGALSVAQVASQLHERRYRRLTRAMTPLELTNLPFGLNAGCVIFSSRARHSDTAVAARTAIDSGLAPASIITHNPSLDKDEFGGARILVLPPPATRDGFLATNSVMSMVVSLILAYDLGELPPVLEDAELQATEQIGARLLVLYETATAPVASDLEARLHETGLATVQIADLRNFAHGRHVGLVRHLKETTILSFELSASEASWEPLFSHLPRSVAVVRVRSPLPWPACLPSLFAASAKFPLHLMGDSGFDPARPRVADFGRKLYHSTYRRPAVRWDAVTRKISAIVNAGAVAPPETEVARLFNEWLDYAAHQHIGGVVLDYDGTIVDQEERYSPPTPAIARLMRRLLRQGVLLGIATGRGKSVHKDLRAVLPEKWWPNVQLGLYNGSVLLRLDEDVLPAERVPDFDSRCIRKAILGVVGDSSGLYDVVERDTQVSIALHRSRGPNQDPPSRLADVLRVNLQPLAPVKILTSGHSLDVVHVQTSKLAVIHRLHDRVDGPILTVGDQGGPGGNDEELLHASRLSLTVDVSSRALDRCWRLGPNVTGSMLLSIYMKSLEPIKYGEVRLDTDKFRLTT
jgi:hypothetical protein